MKKPYLGQHFLHSRSAIENIIQVGDLKPEDQVLEIGPGRGVLTAELLQTGSGVIAVERDDRLISGLEKEFRHSLQTGQLKLLTEDIRNLTPDQPPLADELHGFPYKLIANIPYYLTGRLIKQFLTAGHQPTLIVLLLQLEVVKKITAQENSLLSLSISAYGSPRLIKKVPAGGFSPPPKIDSAILTISDIGKHKFDQHHLPEELFFKVLRAGFAHKRKFLFSNLKQGLSLDPEILEEVFRTMDLDPTIRADKLNEKQWFELASSLKTRL